MLVPSKRNAHSVFSLKHTSPDDDEHNTNNNILLLFADADIAPALLAGLSDVDVLYIALGCRFALDIFTIAQQYRPSPAARFFLRQLSCGFCRIMRDSQCEVVQEAESILLLVFLFLRLVALGGLRFAVRPVVMWPRMPLERMDRPGQSRCYPELHRVSFLVSRDCSRRLGQPLCFERQQMRHLVVETDTDTLTQTHTQNTQKHTTCWNDGDKWCRKIQCAQKRSWRRTCTTKSQSFWN